MLNRAIHAKTNSAMSVRTLARNSFTDCCITGTIERYISTSQPIEAMYADAARILAEHSIQPIQEKIYAHRRVREHALDVRKKAFLANGLDPALPVTFVDGKPLVDQPIAGLQIWGIVPHDPIASDVATVECGNGWTGRMWTVNGSRMLYLPALAGTRKDGQVALSTTEQAQRMFDNANQALESLGFSYQQVVRTWIYLARILDWYGEFNRVRTLHHANVGIGRDLESSTFPASTGIQGRSLDYECFMDVLAVDPAPATSVAVDSIRNSSHQGQAFAYGSAFSRGVTLALEERKTVFISGTASIDAEGRTMHLDDPGCQCLETLQAVAAVLEDQGGSLEDICTAAIFFKDQETYQAYQRLVRQLCLPQFPTICVRADVCRPELLCEIEPVAFI